MAECVFDKNHLKVLAEFFEDGKKCSPNNANTCNYRFKNR